jgi:hypothetical protein
MEENAGAETNVLMLYGQVGTEAQSLLHKV